jgi:polar amino acid transport system substrate-binding protein
VAGGSALLGAPAVRAQTGNLLERLRKDKVAKVAIAAQPPYSEMLPDGTLAGLGPMVVKSVMTKLGVPKLEGIVVPYGEMIPGLMAGRWDFVGGCLSITQARCKQVMFSPPICFDPVTGAYRDDLKDPPASMAEIGQRKMQVGIISGGYMVPMMRSLTTPDKISIFPDNAALMDGLLAKRIDIAIGANSGFTSFKKQRQVAFNITKPMTDMEPAGSGPAFRTTDTELLEAFSTEVLALKKSGEVAKYNEQLGFVYFRDLYDTVTMTESCKRAI